ncbi:MAG: peptidase [Firmicutes bacterium]|nr:peptidase [Bacillota bacterium]
MTDREHAVNALSEMVRCNTQKADQCRELQEWFKNLNRDLMKAVETLKKGA